MTLPEMQERDVLIEDVRGAWDCRLGWSAGSFGDGENLWMAHSHIHYDPKWTARMTDPNQIHSGGLANFADWRARERLIDSIGDLNWCMVSHADKIPWLGLFRKVCEARHVQPNALCHVGHRYRVITEGTLFEALNGARMLLIGHYAPDVLRRWSDLGFRDYYRDMNIRLVEPMGAIKTARADTVLAYHQALADKRVRSGEYDVALVSIGMMAAPLCAELASYGLIAWDLGHIMNAWAGHGLRHRPIIGDRFEYKRLSEGRKL